MTNLNRDSSSDSDQVRAFHSYQTLFSLADADAQISFLGLKFVSTIYSLSTSLSTPLVASSRTLAGILGLCQPRPHATTRASKYENSERLEAASDSDFEIRIRYSDSNSDSELEKGCQ